jgi:hypothetical protein
MGCWMHADSIAPVTKTNVSAERTRIYVFPPRKPGTLAIFASRRGQRFPDAEYSTRTAIGFIPL